MTFDDLAFGFGPDALGRDLMGCPWDADPDTGRDGLMAWSATVAL
jgi:hypothetical protein